RSGCTVPRLRRGGTAEGSPCGMGTRPADRRQTGGAVLAQTSLVLPPCVVPQEDLDRGASCDRTPRVSDRPRSGVGVRAGRRPRRRGGAGRVRARGRRCGGSRVAWAWGGAALGEPAPPAAGRTAPPAPGGRGRRRSGWTRLR